MRIQEYTAVFLHFNREIFDESNSVKSFPVSSWVSGNTVKVFSYDMRLQEYTLVTFNFNCECFDELKSAKFSIPCLKLG